MATRTVVCPECEEPVPYGRLSCPGCGALLASVAGNPRRAEPIPTAAAAVGGGPTPAAPSPAVATTEPGDATTRQRRMRAPLAAPVAARTSSAVPGPARTPSAAFATSGPARQPIGSTPASVPAAAAPAAASRPAFAEAPQPDPSTLPTPDDVEPVGAPGDLDDIAEPAPPEVELPGAPEPEPPSWPGPSGAPAAWASAPGAATPAFGTLQPAWTTSEPVVPAAASTEVPRMPAGAWLPPSAAFGPSVPNGAVAGDPIAAASATPARLRPGVASLFSDLPFDAPDDLPGWVVAIGSAVSVAGFLLPWAAAIPFFTTGIGYMDRWGFAVPSHVLVFLAALGLLVLTILPNRLPEWIRVGVLPLALGGLLLGVVWPYVIGGIGAQIGALSVAFGGLLLIAGGTLAVRPKRHGQRPPAV